MPFASQLWDACVAQNSIHSLTEARGGKIGSLAQFFFVPALDEDCAATGCACATDIAPAIADDVACGKVDVQFRRCAENQACPRLATVTRLSIALAGVIANLNAINEWKSRLHFQSHRFNGFETLRSAADVGLVRDHNQKKIRSFEPRTSVGNILVKLELVDVRWRVRQSVPDGNAVDYSVAIQKNCSSSYFMLSHFVWAIFRSGCEIHKCQTTAWNASVCGVTFVGLIVGMIIATSATCAV